MGKTSFALSIARNTAVDMATGEFYQEEEPDIFIPAPGFDLSIIRKY